MKRRIVLVITLFALMLILIFGVVLYFYTERIYFVGTLNWQSPDVRKAEIITPLGNKQVLSGSETRISGYFREVIITAADSITELSISQEFAGKIAELGYEKISDHTFRLTGQPLSLWVKIQAVMLYNAGKWVSVLLAVFFIALLSGFLKSFTDFLRAFKTRFYVLIRNLIRFLFFHWKMLLMVVLLSLILYPLLYFVFGINFSFLYNQPHFLMYPLVSAVFFIPLFGLVFRKTLSCFGTGFFIFWMIFLLTYFVTAPQVFAGNYGFHGYFHDYILTAQQKNFFSALITPDTGYLAFLPRIVYSIAQGLSPDASQSIALTSLASLIIYASVFSFLAGKTFDFIWRDNRLAFIFIVILALFPVFSVVPGFSFPLSITDTAYYGLIFTFSVLFVHKEIKQGKLFLLILFNSIFILSKAHFIAFLPLYMIAFLIFIRNRNRAGKLIAGFGLLAIFIQAVFCYFSSLQMNIAGQAMISYSLNLFSFQEKIVLTIAYFLKAYVHLLVPFIPVTGNYTMIKLSFAIGVVLVLVFLSFRMLRKKDEQFLSLWFLGGNFIALAFAFFYAYTFPANQPVDRNGAVALISSLPLNLMRYTIGVHTILALTVIPFIIHIITKGVKIKPAFFFSFRGFVLMIFIVLGFAGNPSAWVFPEFWKLVKNERWSYEWKQLTPLLKQKEHFVPVVFYPVNKQFLITSGLSIYADYGKISKSGVSFENAIPLHSVVVLNTSVNRQEDTPVTAELFFRGRKTASVSSLYQTDSTMRFIYFLNNKTSENTDSIVFYNAFFQPIEITTHVRIVKKEKRQP